MPLSWRQQKDALEVAQVSRFPGSGAAERDAGHDHTVNPDVAEFLGKSEGPTDKGLTEPRWRQAGGVFLFCRLLPL
jgi:hypothetical protein